MVALTLMAAWGAIALSQAAQAARQAALAHDALRVRVVLASAREATLTPPNLPVLCQSEPLSPMRVMLTDGSGVSTEVRWHHLGSGIILAKVDVRSHGSGRARLLRWLVPEQYSHREDGVHCDGSRLRAVAGDYAIPQPGE